MTEQRYKVTTNPTKSTFKVVVSQFESSESFQFNKDKDIICSRLLNTDFEERTSIGDHSPKSLKFDESFATQATIEQKEDPGKLQLFQENYNPNKLKPSDGRSPTQGIRLLTHLDKPEVAANFDDVLFTPQAAVVIPKKHLRDIQFYFLINPKSGKGIGQKIIQENPKPFKFLTKFWDGIPFCQEIKDISVNFASLDRLDKLKKVYEQVSSISRVSLGKEVNQYIVICGGDGSLNPILSQLNEYGADFSKLAFSMFPLGTFNDMSRSLKSYKLNKYAKASNFS